jgi:hypothetical protein
MATAALRLPPGLPEAYGRELREALARWVADVRVDGILLLGEAAGRARPAPVADVVVIVNAERPVKTTAARLVFGSGWLRLSIWDYVDFIQRLREGEITKTHGELREAFVAFDRRGRLADARHGIEPLFQRARPKTRIAAAAAVAAALEEAEIALDRGCNYDAAVALTRGCSALARLELLNRGDEAAEECPIGAAKVPSLPAVFALIGQAGAEGAGLRRAGREIAALYRRSLPAAAANIFDFLIKRGGSSTLADVIESLELAEVEGIDLVVTALAEYGLVKIGRAERSLPGLSGVAVREPVLTLP